MRPGGKTLVVLVTLVLAAGIPSLHALWTGDGIVVSSALDAQLDPRITTDGAGGAIITWRDQRSGSNYDIYTQRIDISGNAQWTADGIAVCTASDNQAEPVIVDDGAGGAIIAWQDNRYANLDIFVQRVNGSGIVQWGSNGISITSNMEDQIYPAIAADGTGGAVITWTDRRSGTNYDIYAQSYDASGNAEWTGGIVAVCTAANDQTSSMIVFDGAGGAIITWHDLRNGSNYDIYAQRVDASGIVQWTADGVAVCTALDHQVNATIVSDGAGGAIITWYDGRSASSFDIYAQRIDASGVVQWTADGVAICTNWADQFFPIIVSDGSGGAIITWYDGRSTGDDIYAQRIDASGVVQWTADGIAVCSAHNAQRVPTIDSDGAGGAIITWEDGRSGGWDIYAQWIDALGIAQWTADGIAICTASGNQRDPMIVSDGTGGAIITWEDQRSGNWDVYAQQVDASGRIGYLAPAIHSVCDVPGDEGGKVNIAWDASPYDYVGKEITYYSIWRALDTPAALMMLDGGAAILGSEERIDASAGGSILRLGSLNGQTYYWELIDSHDAYYLEAYSKIVPTACDSSAATNGYHYFQIIAHTADPLVFYVSETDSGYSVDNIAPCPPAMLAGEQQHLPEGLLLYWDPNSEPDLDGYTVYRGLTEDFVPGPGNLIASPCDTFTFDDEWTWDSVYYYKVAAIDIHGNESQYALLRPTDVTGEETPEVPTVFFLAQNFPNPFNPATTIHFGLAHPEHVSLRIYDASGRLVRVLIDDYRTAHRYGVTWDGCDDAGRRVTSGVYFYTLNAGGFEKTRKTVLLR
ncbi:MAG: T9SS type A sorting domain-containing protein [bacterium]|nr:MAG: T9SS type A sorting domain-containing protein [bacterium]